MGVKKSSVCIKAISEVILYTPASSEVSIPTRRFLSFLKLSFLSISERSPGPILDAHPADLTFSVSFSSSIIACLYIFLYVFQFLVMQIRQSIFLPQFHLILYFHQYLCNFHSIRTLFVLFLLPSYYLLFF